MVSLDPTLPEGTRVCLRCSYQLEGLVLSRCPECEQGFDLQNEKSFYTVTYRWGKLLTLVMALNWIPLIIVALTLLVASMISTPEHGFIVLVMLINLASMTIGFVLAFLISLSLIIAFLIRSRQPRNMKWTRVAMVLGLAVSMWGIMGGCWMLFMVPLLEG